MKNKVEYPERTSSHSFGDLIGLVKPEGPIEAREEAANCLLTIREHLQLTAMVLRENQTAITNTDLTSIAHVLDCLHVGAGYALEWVRKHEDKEQETN